MLTQTCHKRERSIDLTSCGLAEVVHALFTSILSVGILKKTAREILSPTRVTIATISIQSEYILIKIVLHIDI